MEYQNGNVTNGQYETNEDGKMFGNQGINSEEKTRRYSKRKLWFEYTDRINWHIEQRRYDLAVEVAREALCLAERRFGCGRKHPYVQFELGRLIKVLTKLAEASQRKVRVPPEFAVAA